MHLPDTPQTTQVAERAELQAWRARLAANGHALYDERQRLIGMHDVEGLRTLIDRLDAHHQDWVAFEQALHSFHRRVGPLN